MYGYISQGWEYPCWPMPHGFHMTKLHREKMVFPHYWRPLRQLVLQWSKNKELALKLKYLSWNIISLVVHRVCLSFSKEVARIGPQYKWVQICFVTYSKTINAVSSNHFLLTTGLSLQASVSLVLHLLSRQGLFSWWDRGRDYRRDEPRSSLPFYHLFEKVQNHCVQKHHLHSWVYAALSQFLWSGPSFGLMESAFRLCFRR